MSRVYLTIALAGALAVSAAPPAAGQAILLPGWLGTATVS
jgi:hypothetical protein